MGGFGKTGFWNTVDAEGNTELVAFNWTFVWQAIFWGIWGMTLGNGDAEKVTDVGCNTWLLSSICMVGKWSGPWGPWDIASTSDLSSRNTYCSKSCHYQIPTTICLPCRVVDCVSVLEFFSTEVTSFENKATKNFLSIGPSSKDCIAMAWKYKWSYISMTKFICSIMIYFKAVTRIGHCLRMTNILKSIQCARYQTMMGI